MLHIPPAGLDSFSSGVFFNYIPVSEELVFATGQQMFDPDPFGRPVCLTSSRQTASLVKTLQRHQLYECERWSGVFERALPLFPELFMVRQREHLWFMELTLVQLQWSWLSAPDLMSSSVLHNPNIHSASLCKHTHTHTTLHKTRDLGHFVC